MAERLIPEINGALLEDHLTDNVIYTEAWRNPSLLDLEVARELGNIALAPRPLITEYGRHPLDRLSVRQYQVSAEAAQGKKYKQIGDTLSISPYTVRSHLWYTYEVLGISEKAQLAAFWQFDPRYFEATDFSGLNKRQHEVLDRMSDGLTNKQIAHELNICFSTVRDYSSQLIGRLGLANKVELTQAAYFWREKTVENTALSVQPYMAQIMHKIEQRVAIPQVVTDKDKAGIQSFVETVLRQDKSIADLRSPHLDSVVHEIVDQEVDWLLRHRSVTAA